MTATGLWKSQNVLAGPQPLFRVASSFCGRAGGQAAGRRELWQAQ
jgi:hypothetical protein